MNNREGVTTRFPPSPTGLLHAGGFRTAIFNYLFARKHHGTFILRIENTDTERSKREYEDNIIESLQWLGLTWDSFYRQSDHTPRYRQALSSLLESGSVYVSKETPKSEGERSEVLRFRNPGIPVTFTDIIRGPITFDTTELGDFIIAKSIEEPLYHFGVVVDDMDEGVTHIIRGEDHISNTPRQILIQRALGQVEPPVYAHLPLVLGEDRAKLSKRKGARAIHEYREMGFIPEAIINYLALIGWHPEGEQEIFSLEELVELFDITRIQKGGGIFDEKKLRWFNKEHLRLLSPEEYGKRLDSFMREHGVAVPAYLPETVPLLKERADTLAEAAETIAAGELSFFQSIIDYDGELLEKRAGVPRQTIGEHLGAASQILSLIPEGEWSPEVIKATLFPYADEQGRSAVLWPLRIALSGREKSPDPFTIAGLIGKEKTLSRLARASEKISG